MLNIPDSVKALFKTDGVHKNFRAHFPNGELPDITNDNVARESVKFTESVCSRDVFKFGLAEQSVIEFETVGVANMYGMTISCSCEIDVTSLTAEQIAEIEAGTWDGEYISLDNSDLSYPFFRVPYGVFRVESCPRDHQAMTHRNVTAYTDIPLLKEEMIPGEYPTKQIKLNPVDWLNAQLLSTEDMVAVNLRLFDPGDEPTWESVTNSLKYTSTGNSVILHGIGTNWPYVDAFYPADFFDAITAEEASLFRKIGVCALRFEFNKHPLDSYATQLYSAAVASLPSGAYVCDVYQQDYQTKYHAVYASTAQMLSGVTGQFTPCFYIGAVYKNSSGIEWERYSKPVFCEPGKTFLLDLTHLEDFAYWRPMRSGFNTLDRVNLYASVPTVWNKYGGYFTYGEYGRENTKTITGWESAAPWSEFDEDVIVREGDVYLYYKDLEANTAVPRVSVDNTLDYRKYGDLRQYYTYANALSTEAIIESAAELMASFYRTNRYGNIQPKRLSDASPIAVAPGEYEQMWWDEYDVEPIGTIRYSYTDKAGETQVADYKIGDGASIYDMTDNAVLKMIDNPDQETIEGILDALFVPHLDSVNFTPIDLSAIGLPYIEAGDYLSVTAQDGTVANSYALRHELSGIQNLFAQIDSESGLIIESEESV